MQFFNTMLEGDPFFEETFVIVFICVGRFLEDFLSDEVPIVAAIYF